MGAEGEEDPRRPIHSSPAAIVRSIAPTTATASRFRCCVRKLPSRTIPAIASATAKASSKVTGASSHEAASGPPRV